MPKVTIPGVGVVNYPDAMSDKDIMAHAEQLQRNKENPLGLDLSYDPREQGIGQLIKGSLKRSWEGFKGNVLEGMPALGASALGYDETAKNLLKQYQERMQAVEAENPAAYPSYKQIQGVGDVLPFLAESTGELVPTAASFIGGAGVGTQIGKYAAKKSVEKFVEKELAGQLAKRGITSEAAAATFQRRITDQAIKQGTEVGSKYGLWGSSLATNVPDTFQQIYQDTNELHPGIALTIGPLVAALDTYLPEKILTQLGSKGKTQLAAALLEKSSVVPITFKRAFISEALKTAGGEALTEGGQQVLQNLASTLSGDKQGFFSQQNIDNIITSALKGAVGGALLGAPGAAVQARQIKNQAAAAAADQLAAKQPPASPTGQASLTPAQIREEKQLAARQQIYGDLFGQPVPQRSAAQIYPVGQETITPEATLAAAKGELNLRGQPVQGELDLQSRDETTPAQFKTVLTADTLKETGLSPQSGFFKQLVNKDLTVPEHQQQVAATLTKVRTNPKLSPATKQAIERVAMNAFGALAQQQEMFGPKGGILKGANNGRVQPRPISPAGGESTEVSGEQIPNEPAEGIATSEQPGMGPTPPSAAVFGAGEEAQRNPLREAETPEDFATIQKHIDDNLQLKTTPPATATTPSSEAPPAVNPAEEFDVPDTQYTRALKKTIAATKDRLAKETNPVKQAFYRNDLEEATNELRRVANESSNAPMRETIKSQPDINAGRLLKMFGPQLYGSPKNITSVSIKEMLQNSFDAIKGMMEQGQVDSGNIEINMDETNRTISIKDDGSGMTPNTLGTTFLTIAGTLKETEFGSGGFGVAKMLFLYGNKNIKVITLRDGKLSTLSATGKELSKALTNPKDTSLAPDIQVFDADETNGQADALFPKGHGTLVEVTIPEDYVDTDTGNTEPIKFDPSKYGYSVLRYSPLFANINVTFNGSTVYSMGSDFEANEYNTFVDAQFNWGTARIYVSNEEKDKYGDNAHILSNGLWQFSNSLTLNPMEAYGDNIPHRFYIDIVSKVKPDETGYPFQFNRQGFTKDAEKDLQLITNYISLHYKQKDFVNTAASFGSVQYLTYDGKTVKATSQSDLVPKVAKNKGKVDKSLAIGSKVEVKNGKLIVNGKTVPLVTPDDLKNATIDTDELKIPQNEVKADQVMVHDNLEVNENGVFTPIAELARDKFGQRFDDFMFQIGDTFIALRDGVADLMPPRTDKFSPKDYKELRSVAVGISFDKEYRGVNILIPFQGMFINPAFPEYIGTPEEAAIGMFGTMIHELAHFQERNHRADFPAEMQRIMIHLEANPNFDLRWLKYKFIEDVRANKDIIDYLNKVGSNANNRAIGQRFKDGSNQARNKTISPNVPQKRGERRGGQRVSSEIGPSYQAIGQKQQLAGVPREDTAPLNGTTFRKENTSAVESKEAKSVFDSFADRIESAGVLSPGRANKLHELIKNGIFGSALKAALWCLPVKPLTEEAKRAGLPMAPEFNNITDQHSGYVNNLNQSIEPLVKRAEDWAKKVGKKFLDMFNDLVYDSTISKIDPTKPKKEETSQADYDRVVNKYKKLDPMGKQLYIQMRNAYAEMYQHILDSIEDRINTLVTDPKTRLQLKQDVLEKLAKRGQIDPYFALTRKGKYWLSYNLNNEPYVEAYETERERNKQAALVEKEGVSDISQFSQLSEYKYSRAPSGSFVNKMLNILEINKPQGLSAEESKRYDESADEVMRLYISTLPETSFAQSFQKRKETLGFKKDAIEALRDRMYNTAQQLGRMRYSAKLNKLLEEMREYSKLASRGMSTEKDAEGKPKAIPKIDNKIINEYIGAFEKHAQAITNPNISSAARMLNTLGFNYLLGFNISSALVNLGQVPMIVAPYLAGEHTWGQTMGAINDAYKTYMNSGFGKDVRSTRMIGGKEIVTQKGMPSITNYGADTEMGKKYAILIEEGKKMGQFNRSQFHDVLEVDGRKDWGNTLNAASSFAFHHGERMNREVSMMAAYDLQLAKLKKQGKTGKEAEIEAAKYAFNVTEMTNGGVSAASAPLIAKNSLGKVLFMFKRYGVSMYYMLFKVTREALKGKTPEIRKAAMSQLAGVYGTSALFAGLQGIPMFGVAAMVYNLFADDDDDDMETATRKYVGEFAYKGMLNYVTGAEIASRTSLSDLIFRSNPSSNSATFAEGIAQTLGGPAYGVGSRIKRGLDFINEGNVQRGVETILPSAFSNILKAYRFGTEGAKSLRGDPITEDISALSLAAQVLGFAPAEYVRQLEINGRLKGIEKTILQQKSKLLQQWNVSNRMGDLDKANEYKQRLKDLNAKHPALGITEDTFEASATAFEAATKRTVNGVQFSQKLYNEMMQNAAEYDGK